MGRVVGAAIGWVAIAVVAGALPACGSSGGGGSAPLDAGADVPAADGSTTCETDGDCGDGERCVDRACVAPCANSLDCVGASGGEVCDTVTGECVDCLADADCDGGRVCVDRVCTKVHTCKNSLDCPSGLVCDAQLGLCVECVIDSDCGDGERCGGNACRPECDSDNDCTPLGLLCDPSVGYCVECTRHADCRETEHCAAGSCRADVCAGGSSKCQGNAIVACDGAGSGFGAPSPCPSGTTCAAAGETAACEKWVCTPSEEKCDAGGERVTACSADGLDLTVKDDCAARGEVCVGVECRAVVCTAGTVFCSGDEVRRCSDRGEASTLVTTCTAAEYCDDSSGPATCRTKICEPDQPACDGDVATTCNSIGSGYLPGGTPCNGSNEVCSDGACATLVCVPGARFCSAGNVRQCDPDGLGSTLLDTCTPTEFCAAATATCEAQVCTPAQPVCDGDVATTCNAIGSGYESGGTDCTLTGKVCSAGGCVAQICTPNELYCDAGDVHLCDPDGLGSTVWDPCSASEYCDTGTATCQPQVCAPGQPACDANVATVCNAEGSGYEPGGADCTPQNCVGGACVDALFLEDFEDGDYAGWTVLSGTHTRAITTTVAANGTSRSLRQTRTSAASHEDGLAHTLPSLKPSSISWWARSGDSSFSGTYFTLYSGAVGSDNLVWHYFKDTGVTRLYVSSSVSVEVAYVANRWYHFELRNIDWSLRTFDYYVDGSLARAGVSFRGSGSQLGSVELHHFDQNAVGYWDEIEMR